MSSPALPTVRDLTTLLDDELPAAIALRHAIHQDPQLSGNEGATIDQLTEALGEPGLRDDHGALMLRVGPDDRSAVAVRAELDALPIAESTTAPWASRNGSMHACGHDVHMAALVAVTRALRAAGAPTPFLAVFQPREETWPSGALDIVASGALEAQRVAAMVGIHLQPLLPVGVISALPVTVNAAADEFDITITGTPGHGAYPHRTDDPIVAAAQIIQSLQFLVSRQVDPMAPTVITVGSIHGGSAPNAIPESVALRGTLRTYTSADRERLIAAISSAAQATAGVHGCSAATAIHRGEPPLANDPRLTIAIANELHAQGFDTSGELRSCGADDFAFYCEHVPSTMVFYGTGSGSPDEPHLHSPHFLPSDDYVEGVAKAMMAAYLAAARLIGS